ncbi:glutamate 5-kinase [Oceanobacillus halophilus]|uniref:Glutamate 5-kinase n=1 Tax=Oceanobacillus halophilus TaxID=930130 RepID=A0A495A306_9BACI|nr:glutamate 5-kinase [Oceanobacillus halophilus]RKQ33884.1 glutamate 5-kinase [Oceanobacillus halophilus]
MAKERIVVKIGSSSLTNEKGEIDQEKLMDHVKAIVELRKRKHEVLLVSSGAVAAGFKKLGYSSRPVTIKGKQAAAAVGQSLLIQTYMEKFQAYNLSAALILLTRSDFSNRERYRNAFATLSELLDRGILPIINENDTVSVDELTFGDNDMLSALVSGFVHADRLIILTDINGIYNGNPRTNPDAKRFDYLENISEDMFKAVDDKGSKVGTGGMKSKLLAAKTALSLGVPVFIGKGAGKNKLLEVIDGNGNGTYIANQDLNWINTRKQWIALHSESSGKIFVDQGAEEAILYNGKSLLSAGVFKVKGIFEKGDVVEVVSANRFLGKGQVKCSSGDLKQRIELRKNQGAEFSSPALEVIHRDHWVEHINKIGEEI